MEEFFPGSFVTHLSKQKSDHLLILLCMKGDLNTPKQKKKRKRYMFEAMWLRDEGCADIVANAWEQCGDICSKIAHTSGQLSAWGRKKFADFAKELKDCRTRMEELMGEPQTANIIAEMKALDDRMDELENREELYWRQRSRQDWLTSGDKNTSFFHAKAKQCVTRNNIGCIKDEAANEFFDEDQITEVFASFYEGLFMSGGTRDSVEVT